MNNDNVNYKAYGCYNEYGAHEEFRCEGHFQNDKDAIKNLQQRLVSQYNYGDGERGYVWISIRKQFGTTENPTYLEISCEHFWIH